MIVVWIRMFESIRVAAVVTVEGREQYMQIRRLYIDYKPIAVGSIP